MGFRGRPLATTVRMLNPARIRARRGVTRRRWLHRDPRLRDPP